MAKRDTPPGLTPEQQEAIRELRAACQKYADAQQALSEANLARTAALRKHWKLAADLGATSLAREIGGDLIGEGTVRSHTKDLTLPYKQGKKKGGNANG